MRVGIAFDRQAAGAGHHRGQRLRAAHAAEPAGQDPLALQVAAIMLAAGLGEGLVGALHDALRADIDPRPGGHLAVHHQALLIELVEMVPVGPVRHEVGIGDQHARRVRMGAERRRPACPTAPAASRRPPAPSGVATMRSKSSQVRAARPMPP